MCWEGCKSDILWLEGSEKSSLMGLMYREQFSPKLAGRNRFRVGEEAARGPVTGQDKGRGIAKTVIRGGLWISFCEGWRTFWRCGALI